MRKTTGDHALAIIKAGLSAVPVLGGLVASLVSDYVPTHTQRSIEKLLAALAERLAQVEGRVDLRGIDKDEFAELFKTCYLLTFRTHQEEKLQGAAGLLANLLLRQDDPLRLSYTELDHFARCLDGLSSGAITVMIEAYRVGLPLVRPNTDSARFNFGDLAIRLPHTTPELLMGLVGELNAMNLVHLAGVPSIRIPDYGNYPIELTPLGIRFVRHIIGVTDR